jgi:lipoprotein-anchoring transpeptidase ErfK/SrfK
MITMGQLRASLGALCLLLWGIGAPTIAAAQGRGPCAQIRAACQDAGFLQGAVRDGIGLQVHCIMPIMQARPQPLTARRPLPNVDPQLVAACQARNAAFGQGRQRPSQALAQPSPVSPPALAPSGNPGREYLDAPNPRRDIVLRPPAAVTADQRALIAALPPEDQPETGPAKSLPPQFRRAQVDYLTKEPAGTIVIDTPHTYLYLVLGNGKAMRYGIGVGREGFTWSGTEKVSKMAEWPDWHPPEEMIERQPYLPRFMAGGEGNPLGARALYLGQTLYRIHGTNQPSTIGTFVSSGCIRLTNDDITDLYGRVQVGTRVVVLPGTQPGVVATANPRPVEPASRPRPRTSAAAEKPGTAQKPAAARAPAAPAPATVAKPETTPSKDTTSANASPVATPAPPADELIE